MVIFGKIFDFSANFMEINTLILIFNLLPIYPLDGFKTIKDLFLVFYEEEFTHFVLYKFSLILNLIIILVLFIYKKYFYLLIFVSLIFKLREFNDEVVYSKLNNHLILRKINF